ncbi:glycoside hydrolase family 43 protein [Bacteroides oleiciplenus]|nr:glycoside hydrolase family 43 protein [Bacteroides oleiciplenus]
MKTFIYSFMLFLSFSSVFANNLQTSIEKIKASLIIHNGDDIRGNITLLREKDGATITWKSSHPKVISDKDIQLENVNVEAYNIIPAGVVIRQKRDCKVALTATIDFNGLKETKTFNVTVKARPQKKKLEAYIFTFFPSNREEQIYLAAGKDPLHFTDLNGGKPILESTVGNMGVRDPYILRSYEGDKFYLIATDLKVQTQGFETEKGSLYMVVWESLDLINWSKPRLADLGARAFIEEYGQHLGCVYAPEAIYDEFTGEYVVFWTSRIYPNYPATLSGRRYKVFYSRTRDFVHFTPGEIYIDRTPGDIIDTSMIQASDGKYYRVSADGLMSIEKSDYILGEWKTISDLTNLHKRMNGYLKYWADTNVELRGKLIEGPQLFKFNDEDIYGLYSDNYQKPGLGYIPTTTTEISDTTGTKWQLYTRDQYDFGKLRKRHGSIIGITEEEYINLMKKWGR